MDPHTTADALGLTTPDAWPWASAARPFVSSDRTAWQGALLRSWSGTSPVMVQPPLDHHYVVMHLGGSKRVTRSREGRTISTVAECGSLTVVPAGTAYVWKTEGPIAFAHLYLRPQQLQSVMGAELSCASGDAGLVPSVGARDLLLEPVFARMLDELRTTDAPSRLLLDSLLESFCIRLAQKHLAGPAHRQTPALALAPHRLRRVLDFIESHLGNDIGLADLVEAAGTSQFHFSRAFRIETGVSPYRYLLRRRIELARVLLLASDQPLPAVSAACGFNSPHQFAVMFKRQVGAGPKQFRLACNGRRTEAVAARGAGTTASDDSSRHRICRER